MLRVTISITTTRILEENVHYPLFNSLCAPEGILQFTSVLVALANCFFCFLHPSPHTEGFTMVRASTTSAHPTSKASDGHRLSLRTRQDNVPNTAGGREKNPCFPKILWHLNWMWPQYQWQIQRLKPTHSCVLQGPTYPLCSSCQNSRVLAQRKSLTSSWPWGHGSHFQIRAPHDFSYSLVKDSQSFLTRENILSLQGNPFW